MIWRGRFIEKQDKLTQYGKRVWNLTGSNEEIAKEAISKTELFFQSLGVKTKLSDYTSEYEGCEKTIKSIFKDRGWELSGERKSINLDDVETIVKSSF